MELPPNLFERYQELCSYVGWTEADRLRVAAAGKLVAPEFPALIDDFYAEINRHPNARRVISGGHEQFQRLKVTLRQWLTELFCGTYDADYVARRWRVGWRHVEIGLPQVYTNAALSRLRNGLLLSLERHWEGDRRELPETRRSLNILLDLDLAIILDAYQAEFAARQQRQERLATIGQVAGGVAHELRNPLNVVKTSVYYLLHARALSAEKMGEHLRRIERQVGLADSVITALSDFAKLPLPQQKRVALCSCVTEALEANPPPPHITVELNCPESVPLVLADPDQLRIVFGNLIRNACDAMPQGGRLEITAATSGERVEITFRDTGVGIPPEKLARITEPLYSSKTRGLGLGLAITRAILDKHEGELHVSSQVGQGSTFTVRLNAAPNT
jgi:signal transduction histidine kinase